MSAVVFTVGLICSPRTSAGARGFVTMFTTSDFRLGCFSFLFGALGLACFRVRFLSYKAQLNCKIYKVFELLCIHTIRAQNNKKMTFTVHKRSYGKAMFLHLSVIMFGGGLPSACTPLRKHTHPWKHPHPRPTATAADGTHSTGMLSCLVGNLTVDYIRNHLYTFCSNEISLYQNHRQS